MEDGTSRVIPLVTEAVGLLDIDYRDFRALPVMSFSLHGMWSCTKSGKDFSSWCEDHMRRFLEGTDFIRCADGLDVFLDVGHARSVLPAMSMESHCLAMGAALDAAACRFQIEKMLWVRLFMRHPVV
jgi:hypothetical protein